MVKAAVKFTPEVLLSTPRRSTGQPSPDGQFVLHSLQSYSFETSKRTKELRVLETKNSLSHLVVGDSGFSEAVWLPANHILYLRDEANDTGKTELVQTDIYGVTHTVIGAVDGAISDLKLKQLSNGDVAFVAWGKADRHGELVNEKVGVKPAHTSMLYDRLMVRHWDEFKTRYHNSLFYGVLTTDVVRGWALKSFDSILAGTKLESPIAPFPGSDHYDISETGVIFVAKDPTLNDATHTKSELYFIPTPQDALITNFGQTAPLMVAAQGIKGAASSPVFAPDGRSAAFLKQSEDGYESDQRLVIYVPDVAGACLYTSSGACSISCPQSCTSVHQAARPIKLVQSRDAWDISPEKLSFGQDSNSLFMLAEDRGVTRLYYCDIASGTVEPFSKPSLGSISDLQPLSNPPRFFISGSNLVDNSFYATINPANPNEADPISSHSRDGRAYGLHKHQLDSLWYQGAADRLVHALVLRPSDFDESKTYPLAMLIHGGPQGAWTDSWSTRWNPAVWTEQGYVVVMPNVTGSTGYGQKFTDAIAGRWGAEPYEDVVKCLDYVQANLPYVDTERAIAAGASYGGYMMYWIAGQPLAKRFKTLIAHDGVFNAVGAQMSGDELYFPFHDFGGTLWDQPGEWIKYDPSAHTANWTTPMLIIHNGRDYRLSIAEGLAAFNVLQVKGIPSRFLTAPDENHWTLGEQNSRVWHTVVLNWANKYAGLSPYREDESAVIEASEPF